MGLNTWTVCWLTRKKNGGTKLKEIKDGVDTNKLRILNEKSLQQQVHRIRYIKHKNCNTELQETKGRKGQNLTNKLI